ncbi:hypothetical protein RBSH_04591 [Rhodopirellula baltica SH28]|uniref:Uncharacterized protein n=1 Tax=Rhodopirellula baltica SH28 TaxID=993517 RepID=K5DB85_RHOBT|nr:hypothetical protein RBSH_04591 [Rhodopirellula baltica SH28]
MALGQPAAILSSLVERQFFNEQRILTAKASMVGDGVPFNHTLEDQI